MLNLRNLLSNAIKFTPKGGAISINAEINQNKTAISISDNGIGIPKQELASIFSIDSNFNRPGTEDERSTGIGLIICKEYADIISAELSVKSQENIGTTFLLELKNN